MSSLHSQVSQFGKTLLPDRCLRRESMLFNASLSHNMMMKQLLSAVSLRFQNWQFHASYFMTCWHFPVASRPKGPWTSFSVTPPFAVEMVRSFWVPLFAARFAFTRKNNMKVIGNEKHQKKDNKIPVNKCKKVYIRAGSCFSICLPLVSKHVFVFIWFVLNQEPLLQAQNSIKVLNAEKEL